MKKSEQTKERIEEAALALFYEKGFEGASTAEIAQNAGVAEGTIFRYFPTKKTILSDLMVKFIERFGERIVLDSIRKVFEEKKEEPLEILLKAIIMDRYELFKTHSNLAFVIFSEVRYHPDLMNSLKTHVLDKVLEFIIQSFKEHASSEKYRDDIPYELAIRSFMGAAMLAIIQREVFYIDTMNLPFEEELDLIIDLYLNGIKKRCGYDE